MRNEAGWSFLFDDNEPAINFKNELKYNFKRYIVDLLIIVPFLLSLIILFIYKKLRTPNLEKKILLGTVPIVTFYLLTKLLKQNGFNTTLFVFDDWSNGNFHNDISFSDICKNKFLNKESYLFGPYISFLWALNKFDIYTLYFNSGFLERTIFWRIEPIIYQLFNKKVILFPYGSDVWSIKQNSNRVQKLGHMMSLKKYFHLDKKIESRVYHWSKYVNLIIATVNYIDFLQKIDILVYHGHIIDDINNKKYTYNFKNTDDIKIIHYANDKVRKGSNYIENSLKKSNNHINNLEFYYAEKRDVILSKLDSSHFYIEQLTDGFFSYSALEAMIKGKIVFLYLDESINDMYKIVNSNYYIDFFDNSPIVNINLYNLEDRLIEYQNKNFNELKEISLKSREFAIKLLQENEKMYLKIFDRLVK
ncbi:hypothetical protein [Sulfurimonas sp.]|uniref:hypothetical protein n=1 Tax=Sulfurimonas sp. TaxID=2022749 RepID=UPI002B45E386|nr:hypothetical protein [Sulfurimonas sp.]